MSKQKKYSKIVTEITMLTPEKAQSLLDNQIDQQRKLTEKYVVKYSDAFNRGLWMFDGTPVRVDWFGQMIDGQHRCKMVIRTGQAVKVLIIYGLDPDVFQVLDSGKRRTLADAFRIQGEKYCTVLASAITLLHSYDNGEMPSGHGPSGGFHLLQTEDAIKLLQKHPNMRMSLKKVQLVRSVLQESAAAFLHYLFCKKNTSQADEFFEKLGSGEGFKKKDPIRVLRDRLLFNKTEANKMTRGCKIALTIKAWNVFRVRGTLTKLAWRTSKRSDEPMPKIM